MTQTPKENKTVKIVDEFLDKEEFFLDDYEDIASTTMNIQHPVTGKPTDMEIIIAGPEHPARKRLVQARQRVMRQELEKSGKIKLNDPTEDDQDELELLIACTLGFNNLRTRGGAIEFNPENVIALYTDPTKNWIKKQVREKLDQTELFIRRSATV